MSGLDETLSEQQLALPIEERFSLSDEEILEVRNLRALKARAEALLLEAERKAWDSLAHNKEQGFGYWAAKVTQFRELLGRSHEPSPFASLRTAARRRKPSR
jgi:hypothetical protein